MTHRISVSVLLPEDGSERLLDGIYAQTFQDFEILASTAVANRPKVRVIPRAPLAPASFRNAQVQMARGTLLCLLLPEQSLAPHTFERAVRTLAEKPAVAGVSCSFQNTEEGVGSLASAPELLSHDLFPNGGVVRREVAMTMPFDPTFTDERALAWDFWVSLATHHHRLWIARKTVRDVSTQQRFLEKHEKLYLTGHRTAFLELRESHDELAAELAKRSSELGALREALAEARALHHATRGLKEELVAAKRAEKQAKGEAESAQKDLDRQNREGLRLADELDRAHWEIYRMSASLNARNHEVLDLHDELHRRHLENQALHATLGDLGGALERAERDQERLARLLEDVYASKSWRVTKPLRRVLTWMNRP